MTTMTTAKGTTMRIDSRPWAFGLALLISACSDTPSGGHGHDHGPEGGHAAHEDHDAPAVVHTDFSEHTELFVEFSPLVAGQTSPFAAHVTRLSDFKPLTDGRLDVLLQREGRTIARFRVNEPTRPGIFRPGVAPRDSGEFDLTIEVSLGEVTARHALGKVRVFPSKEAIRGLAGHPEGDIQYLKEQQWDNLFATVPAKSRPLRRSVPGFGTVTAPADGAATVRAPADGYIANAPLIQPGREVTQGTTLGVLIPRLGDQSDVGSLMVALEQARSRLALAESDVERLDGLLAQGAIPERRLLEAREALDVAQAEFRAARARAEQYESGNAEAGLALRAPVAGEVVTTNVSPGAFIKAGEPLFRIAAPERRWLAIRIPERFAGQLSRSSGAWLDQPEGPLVLDAHHSARVVRFDSAVDPDTRTAGVTVEYPTELGPTLLGARMAVHVFTEPASLRLAIPRSSVIDDDGRPVVYVQISGESFERRPVELGVRDGAWVEVQQGLNAGDRVVSEGAYLVKLASAGGGEIGHGHAH
ncbi:efflux RND transporter periplasmic adaptor subunit [Marinimicrobium locisalis]|uniref:efflux RND transporter periplasmic adaptor subunit n=1 Tax=Marinimicrobium locisalis TaxID=546022 RepID=UPI003222041A